MNIDFGSSYGDETCPPDEIEHFLHMRESYDTELAVRQLLRTAILDAIKEVG